MQTQELLAKLISFKSTADNPEEIKKGLEYIASLFDRAKFEVQGFVKKDKYSLLVSFKEKDALNPKILLNGHFDVVPAENGDQYQMRVEEGRAYGRGTLDMKGMVAVLVEVMRELSRQQNPPDVALLLNGDEEMGGASGAGYMVREVGMRPAFVICPDGGGEEKFDIVHKGKGMVWLELVAAGKGAHGAYLWLGENAIEKLMGAIVKVKQFVGPLQPEAWKSTVNLGIIQTSNKTPNKVPGDARAVLDVRFTEELGKSPKEVAQTIKNLVPEVGVQILEGSSLFIVEESDKTLARFKQVAEQVLGGQVEFAHAHGAADIRYFGEVGIPGVLFGSLGEGMHAAGEWVDLESLETNKEILLKFLRG